MTHDRLLHLALRRDWEGAAAVGEYRVSSLGLTLEQQGFIHLSLPHQLAGVAARFYAEVDEDLVVLEIDPDAVGSPVVLEPGAPGSDDLFPHLYGPLPTSAVAEVRPASVVDGVLSVS